MRYFEKIKYLFTAVNSVFIFSKCLYLKTLKQSLLLGFVLLIGLVGFSQNQASENKIFGQIIDKNSKDSIPLCLVEIFDDHKNRIAFAKSSFDGEFYLTYCSNLTTSINIDIKLSAVGYYSKTFQLNVQKYTKQTFELKLDPNSQITLDSINNLTPFFCGETDVYILDSTNKNDLFKHYCTDHVKTLEELIIDNDNLSAWKPLVLDSLSICDEATIRAIYDGQSNFYYSIGYGLMTLSPKEWDYYNFKNKLAKQKYNIRISNGGCVITEENSCYSGKMAEIIYREFGDTIFNTLEEEAKIEYDHIIQKRIDSNYIFKWEVVDKEPYFIDGNDNLKKLLKKNLTYEPDTSGTVYCSFIVNIDGSLTDFKIVKGLSDEINNETIRLLKLMPNWSPGILNGQKVRTIVNLPIKFTT